MMAIIQVGLELPPLLEQPTTRQLVMYAGASQDFYEIHYDQSFALEHGLPGVIVHGLLKAAWLCKCVTRWAGPEAFITRISCEYRGLDLVGEPYEIGGRVVEATRKADGQHVEVEVWGADSRGKKTTLGSIVVLIPE